MNLNFLVSDYFLDEDGNEKYTKYAHTDKERYRVTNDRSLIFARRNGVPYYAKDDSGYDYYPKIDNVEIPIDENNDQRYVEFQGLEFYPQNANGDEYVIMNGNNPKYARNKSGIFYYPKDAEANDMVISNTYLYNDDGSVKYPMAATNFVIYPIDPGTKSEYYVMGQNGKFSIGKKENNVHQYARKYFDTPEGPSLFEFYPEDGGYGYDELGNPIYIEDYDGNIVFPKDPQNNEYYLRKKDSDYIICEDAHGNQQYQKDGSKKERYQDTNDISKLFAIHDKVPYYAKDESLNEYYPVVFDKQVLIDGKYAKYENGKEIYPKDEFLNEYVILEEQTLDTGSLWSLPLRINTVGSKKILTRECHSYFRNRVSTTRLKPPLRALQQNVVSTNRILP
ncbi:hypothetical protein JTE90_022590 [Oedothorax gibbosus]|uniref:Uncharacterized protein n=1 Tax=Oedothorax gibbosus TaxID=931172 RepID=A0AAV6TG99_9ARAC|nr:hypothetical protein JTE90_022590 [Oedothorax gibbosus]